jgi:dienelactone hydrolase
MTTFPSHDSRRQFLARSAAGAVALAGRSTPVAGQEFPVDARSPEDPEVLRSRLQQCLGGPWPEPPPLEPRLGPILQRPGYRIEPVSYQVEVGDRVPALLLVPEGVDAGRPAPAIAVWHQHNGEWHLGKSEPAGLAGNPMHHTGAALAREGYVVLCPDALCFEDRRDPAGKLAGGDFERFEFLRYVVQGKCLAWKNILDMRRAIDYLASRREVAADRIGCYGHSMGSTHCWLVGPHEPRLKAVCGNCCLPTYAAIHATKILHCFPNFVPGWLLHGDTPEMAGLIAPRALHLNLGETDGGSPIAFAREGVGRIAEAYAAAGAAERFSYLIEPETGHELSPAMWQHVRDFFARAL